MGAQGTAVLDFGAFPGKSDASVAVTGQGAIVAGSLVEAWIRPVATADHTVGEHLVELIKIVAADIIAGTGFTIYGIDVTPESGAREDERGIGMYPRANVGNTRIYGQWTVAWVWN